VSCLIGWAINNGDLNHERVQNRINFLLTCKWCRVRFTLTDELLEHEKVYEMLDELIDKPPVPLSQDNSGYGTLSHTQNGSFNTSMEVPMQEISLNNTKNSNMEDTSYTEDDSLVLPLLTDLENLLENISEPVHEASPHTPSIQNEILKDKSPYPFINSEREDTCENSVVDISSAHTDLPQTPYRHDIESQYGAGSTDQSTDNAYILKKKRGEKTFAKNLAVETTYKIKFTETWKGMKLRTLLTQLHEMFKNVLGRTRGDDQDLGRVVITYPQLNNPSSYPFRNGPS